MYRAFLFLISLMFFMVFVAMPGLMAKTTVMAPPISCATALKNFDSLKFERELRTPLDAHTAKILAGASIQLSTGSDQALSYELYLSPILDWTDRLSAELIRVNEMQEFLFLHLRRYLQLKAAYDDPATEFGKPIEFKRIGNINHEKRTAKRVEYYTKPHLTFKDRGAIKKEMDKVVAEMGLVRDEYLPEALVAVGVYRWLLLKPYNEAVAQDRAEARERVMIARKSENKDRADLKTLVKEAREKQSARYLLDIIYLSVEDEAAFIKKFYNGSPDVQFMQTLDATIGEKLNSYYDSLMFQARKVSETSKEAALRGYKGIKAVHGFWAAVRTVLGVGAIYTAALALGSDVVDKTQAGYRWLVTPDIVLKYEEIQAREAERKVQIADETITGVADPSDPEDVRKSFAEVYANYIRKNAGDRAALLFSRAAKHWVETGRDDWQPPFENEKQFAEDKARMAQIADLIAMANVQIFNIGPYPNADGTPQRFLSSAVQDRWPWRTETEENIKFVLEAIQKREVNGPIPLPGGVLPPSYMPKPDPAKEWKIVIASEKLGNLVLEKGQYWFWDVDAVRYAWMVALGFGGIHYGRKIIHRRRAARFEPLELEAPIERPIAIEVR